MKYYICMSDNILRLFYCWWSSYVSRLLGLTPANCVSHSVFLCPFSCSMVTLIVIFSVFIILILVLVFKSKPRGSFWDPVVICGVFVRPQVMRGCVRHTECLSSVWNRLCTVCLCSFWWFVQESMVTAATKQKLWLLRLQLSQEILL